MSNKRIDYIDVAKGLLICLIVIGHATNFNSPITYILKVWIYSFHVPAFLIITGFLISKEKLANTEFGEFVKKKAKSLLVPYVIFELMAGCCQMILFGTESVSVLGMIYGMVTMHCNAGADWYLPTLFMAEMLVFLVNYLLKEHKNWTIPVSFLGGYLMSDIILLRILCRVLIAYGFILIGMCYKKVILKFVNGDRATFSVLGCMTLICAYANGIVDLSMRQFNNIVIYIFGAIVGTIFILKFSNIIKNNVLIAVGRSSLIIMGTHQNLLVIFNRLFETSTYNFGQQCIVLVVMIPFEIVMVYALNKFFRILLGHNR